MISFIYNQCYSLGHAFGFGAMEGFILYVSIIMYAVTTKQGDKK